MFSFQGASSPFPLSNQNPLMLGFSLVRLDAWVIRDSVKSQIPLGFQSISRLSNDSICKVVGQNGLEPSTSRLSVVCSSQLSYWPVFSWLTSSSGTWWRLAGSNRWPPACKAGALPAELNPRISGHIPPFGRMPSKLNNATTQLPQTLTRMLQVLIQYLRSP